jgi:dihydrofolate reductase
MENITIIAALSKNNVIGFNEKIPWKIKDDMIHFKDLTMGHPVIMGRKTYKSLPESFRPLPGRKNIVMSKSLESIEGIYLAKNIGEALKITENQEAYIIGGSQIYESFLPFANKMELTRIHRNYEGDVYFPEINWKEWSLVN